MLGQSFCLRSFFLALTVLTRAVSHLAGTATFTYGGTPVTRHDPLLAQDDKIVRPEGQRKCEPARPVHAPVPPLTTKENMPRACMSMHCKRRGPTRIKKRDIRDFCTVFVTLTPAQQNQMYHGWGQQ